MKFGFGNIGSRNDLYRHFPIDRFGGHVGIRLQADRLDQFGAKPFVVGVQHQLVVDLAPETVIRRVDDCVGVGFTETDDPARPNPVSVGEGPTATDERQCGDGIERRPCLSGSEETTNLIDVAPKLPSTSVPYLSQFIQKFPRNHAAPPVRQILLAASKAVTSA